MLEGEYPECGHFDYSDTGELLNCANRLIFNSIGQVAFPSAGCCEVSSDAVAGRLNADLTSDTSNSAAKIVDVDVDDVSHGVEIEFPDLLDDGRTPDQVAIVHHEEFQ